MVQSFPYAIQRALVKDAVLIAIDILRYEYLTQLLLDANYVPLILKLWQSQDIGRACHFNLVREEFGYVYPT